MGKTEISIGYSLIDGRLGPSGAQVKGSVSGGVTFGKEGYSGPTFSGSASLSGNLGPVSGSISTDIPGLKGLNTSGGFSFGGTGLTYNIDEFNDFKLKAAGFYIGFKFPETEYVDAGSESYSFVSGYGRVKTAVNGSVITGAIDKAELRRDLLSIEANKFTTVALEDLRRDLATGDVGAARENLVEALADLSLRGVSVLNDAVTKDNDLFTDVFSLAARKAIASGIYPDGPLRAVAASGVSGSSEATSFAGSASGATSSSQKDSGVEGSSGGTPNSDGESGMTGTSGHPQKDRDMDPSPSRGDYSSRPDSYDHGAQGGWNSGIPVLLDLDGNGIEITELSASTHFMDADGDGLLNRTAWAGAGDAVLFYDPDGRNAITEARQYIFSEWDPTAGSDMEALRAVFDANGDGKLTAADADFAKFKLLVTNADGSTSVVTLASLGIVELDLTADSTRIEFADGSVIDGQSTFTRSDGSTGTMGSTVLVSESDGHRVTEAVSTDASGNRVVVETGYGAGGEVAFVTRSVTSPSGSHVTNFYDDDGNGVVDRVQTIDTVAQPDGTEIETVVNRVGSNVATGLTVSRVVTSRSADGADVSIDRDSTGGGWFDQSEVQTIHADGSRTVVITDLAKDGTVIRSSTETMTPDGQTRSDAIDEDGSGTTDLTETHVISTDAAGVRTEETTLTNGDSSLRSVSTEVTSADGRGRTATHDCDGDGDIDLTEQTTITVNADGSTTSTFLVTNADGSTRSSSTQTQSDDALTKTRSIDIDGDSDIDRTSVDQTVVNTDGSRVSTVTVTNADGSVRSMERVSLGADKVTSSTWVDLDQDGVFDATDLVKEVAVDALTQARTSTIWDRASDGSIVATSTSTTSADGLNVQTTVDADGDGDCDTSVSDITLVAGSGASTRTIETRNQDGTLRNSREVHKSADGLATTTETDRNGDGAADSLHVESYVVSGDGSYTLTITDYAGDGVALLGEVSTQVSADRRNTIVSTDRDGDGHLDGVTTSVEADDGSLTTTRTSYFADGEVAEYAVETLSANGLETTTAIDQDGDLIFDRTTTSTTALNVDGSRTTAVETQNGDASIRARTVSTVSDDGLAVSTQTDGDGDGTFERTATSTSVLNSDGSETRTEEVRSSDGSLLSGTSSTTSDDGLEITVRRDRDGDGAWDISETSTTTLLSDGGEQRTVELRDAAGALRHLVQSSTSDDARVQQTYVDENGDGTWDTTTSLTELDSGVVIETQSEYSAGQLQSRAEITTSANGLSKTVHDDFDGDGVDDQITTDVTTLLSDGSSSNLIEISGNDGTLISRRSLLTSDDGFTATVKEDVDGDGVDDLTTISSTTIASNGSVTVSRAQVAADGSTLNTSSRLTTADQRTVTETFDTDGDGQTDRLSTRAVLDDGSVSVAEQFYSSGGALEASTNLATSGNGLRSYETRDRNGDGEADFVRVTTTSRAGDGSVDVDVSYSNGRNVSIGHERHHVSDDGLVSSAELDLDGDGLFELRSGSVISYAADGTIVETQITRDAELSVVGASTTTTSGDGLASHTEIDFDGDGFVDRAVHTLLGAGGAPPGRSRRWGLVMIFFTRR